MTYNSTNTNSFIDRMRDQYKEKGGRLVGCLCYANVRTDGVPIKAIKDLMEDNEAIPNDWIPEDLNPTVLYLQEIATVTQMAKKKLEIVEGFDLEQHDGYTVKKIFQQAGETVGDVCTLHRVFHRKANYVQKDVGSHDAQVLDRDIDESILIRLELCDEDDPNAVPGTNLKLMVDVDNADDLSNFVPFLKTVQKRFYERVNGVYSSKQIAALLRDIFDKVNATMVTRGMRFVHSTQCEGIEALAQDLRVFNGDISISRIPVINWGDDDMNETFNDLATDFTLAVTDDVNNFVQEVNKLLVAEKTRPSTLAKRLEEAKELLDRVRIYKQDALLRTDAVEELLSECVDALLEDVELEVEV